MRAKRVQGCPIKALGRGLLILEKERKITNLAAASSVMLAYDGFNCAIYREWSLRPCRRRGEVDGP